MGDASRLARWKRAVRAQLVFHSDRGVTTIDAADGDHRGPRTVADRAGQAGVCAGRSGPVALEGVERPGLARVLNADEQRLVVWRQVDRSTVV